jgi:threonine dehydratase
MRFEFPEGPGAFTGFLHKLQPLQDGKQTNHHHWNCSMFHYRNHGSDIGRVLVGVQVPPERDTEFSGLLAELADMGYRAHDETANPAYLDFLR